MKVVLTQSQGRLEALAERLAERGHDVRRLPLIALETRPAAELRRGVERLGRCPWLLFTSRQAVQAWADAGGSLTERSAGAERRIGAVGPGTAASIRELGGQVSLVAAEASGRGLAAAFLACGGRGPVALPLGERSSGDLRWALAAAGVEARTLVVYGSRPLVWPEDLGPVDVIFVASPSALEALPLSVARGARLVALGPSTAAAVRARGLECLQASAPDPERVLAAIESALSAAPPRPKGSERSMTKPDLTRRPRRLRATPAIRELVAETTLSASNLIAPFFVVPGCDRLEAIAALPGVSRYSPDRLLPALEEALKLGIRAVLLFGVLPDSDKDPEGAGGADPAGPVPSALRAAREAFGNDLSLITDVCLCAHTDHGHCGVLRETSRGVIVDNDASLERLAAMALTHAEAGAHIVAPSDMMDGRVGAIRGALDASGFSEVSILAYSVKYASAFYGPFREAAGSAPSFGDRSSYQMDPRNAREALLEARLDEAQGADMLMVKPALAYLDIIARVRAASELPLAAYNVSGEYALLRHGAAAGALDYGRAVRETLNAIRRAGADLVITYHAQEALREGWL